MINLKTTAIAVASLAGACAMANSASAMPMSSADNQMMSSCMAMSGDAMMADKGCMGMMKKMKITNAQMKKMMSCKAMSHDAMMANKKCKSMMKAHPDMMKMDMAK